jgi:uncharacterized protein
MLAYTSPDRYRGLQMQSCYVEMRDGVRLAVEIILPKPHAAGTKFPVLLHQTRYWRLPELRKPFHWFSDGLLSHLGKMVREIVHSGYAFVNVDCRGSGASFGNQPFPWHPGEVADGHDMVEWILKQAWSNGLLGTIGVSYTGTAAEFLLSTQHPAIKAVMPLFSLYDVFEDIALPGGIPHDGFVQEWGRANSMLDANQLPVDDFMAHLLVKGVKPVSGPDGKRHLAEAIVDHQQNQHVHLTSQGVEYRDQAPSNGVVSSMDMFSPHSVTSRSNSTQAAVYSGSGWLDGAYPHSAIRRFLNLKTPVNRLLLGPWDHGAKFHITPGKQRKTGPELAGEAIKFFDHYVKGYATGIDREPPVLYFTMQEEKWKRASAWPPQGAVKTHYALSSGQRLIEDGGQLPQAAATILHTPTLGTGERTRWRGLLGRATTGQLYPDRNFRGKYLLLFESEPLAQDMEVTGHPLLHLWLRTMETDGAIFAYLEDVTPGKEVLYVTEGMRRLIHRSTGGQAYLDAVPNPSYDRADAAPLVPGLATQVSFDLLPTSYLFRKGHRIRLGITTGDKDNFKQICREGAAYEILLGGDTATTLELPVMPR